ncbi:uncharacterized protein [Rutidosis leptorrhynchoides]|uniref:uncharacterized protein n=1 Tax=Rutidosis leptorrhynchoides TaxID=125765 RepID=UPI003A998A51
MDRERQGESEVSRPSLADLEYPSLTLGEAQSLEAPFSESEILDAINDCGSDKAPGPDGFNLRFFKKFWGTIKDDVISAIQWFWDKGELSRGCNSSFVTLIPKKCEPLTLSDYRPISLIGSFYKILAKILSNRLKKVIPRLIGSEQSAFLKERYILDGVLVANESLCFMKSNKKKGIIFKADFEKVFDSLNWDFLMEVMGCMRFGSKWCKWISSCLSSAKISILVNGSPTREFTIGRGVRQGDSLSPFLFILAAEGLNILTKATVDRGLFKGVEIGNDKILVSHLQFADDTMFFGDWSSANARNLLNILKCFELSYGLKVNFRKSCLYGVGVDHNEVVRLANRMGCQAGKLPFIYLGLPIGAILNSLPLYYFALFRAPTCVLKILESVRRSFFWGGDNSGSKINWVKWEHTCSSYREGGLNIGSLKAKNLALLGKWWWKFKTETDCLWSKVIRSIYGIDGCLGSDSGLAHRSTSSTWYNIICAGNYIEELQVPFKSSFTKSVGNGDSTSFWNEVWCGSDSFRNNFPRLFRLESNKDALISERISPLEEHVANQNVVATVVSSAPSHSGRGVATVAAGPNQPVAPSVATRSGLSASTFQFHWVWVRAPSGRTGGELIDLTNLLRSISLDFSVRDSWKWSLSSNGLFEVKKLSSLIDAKLLNYGNDISCESLRNNLVPKKVEVFVWRALLKRIPVRVELDKRGIDLHSVRCPVCNDDMESVDHFLYRCKFTVDIWTRIFKWWNFENLSNLNGSNYLRGISSRSMSSFGKYLWQAVEWACVYLLWKNRNATVFNNKISIAPVLLNDIQIKSFEWISGPLKGKDTSIDWLNWLSNPHVFLHR